MNYCYLPKNAQFVPILRRHGLRVTKRRGKPIWTVYDRSGGSTFLVWTRGWGWEWTDSWGYLLLKAAGCWNYGEADYDT